MFKWMRKSLGGVASEASKENSTEGATWAGKDSDGDLCEYPFLKEGLLRCKTNTSRQKVDLES